MGEEKTIVEMAPGKAMKIYSWQRQKNPG